MTTKEFDVLYNKIRVDVVNERFNIDELTKRLKSMTKDNTKITLQEQLNFISSEQRLYTDTVIMTLFYSLIDQGFFE